MDVLDFDASAVKSLAWPATVVIAMALFREPLAALIGRIRRVTVSDGSTIIDFRAALDDVEARLQPGGARAPFARPLVADLLQSQAPPAGIIDAAWTRLQDALGRGTSPVSAALVEVIASLHALRDQAVEQRPAGLTAGDARRFENAVASVVGKIQAV